MPNGRGRPTGPGDEFDPITDRIERALNDQLAALVQRHTPRPRRQSPPVKPGKIAEWFGDRGHTVLIALIVIIGSFILIGINWHREMPSERAETALISLIASALAYVFGRLSR
jgi:hypothetical protein